MGNAILSTCKAQGEDVQLENILGVQGVTGGICAALLWIQQKCMRGIGRAARVAILEPFYTYHKQQVERVTGIAPIYVGMGEGMAPGLASLEQLAASKAIDACVVCNPSNPSGKMWTAEELKRISTLDILLIFDECYSDMVFARPHTSVTTYLNDRVVVCRGFSKCVGCQSWRVGYCLSSAQLIKELMPVMDPLYICTPLNQIAIARFLVEDPHVYRTHIAKVNELMRANWADLAPAFAARFGWTPFEPEGTMYGCFGTRMPPTWSQRVAVLRRRESACAQGVCLWSPGSREALSASIAESAARSARTS